MNNHPLADLFPMLDEDELKELAADIQKNGLLDEIVVLDGQILDGRNRYRACRIAGVEPRFTEFSGGDPAAFVIAKNLHRRHLTASQRAMIAARLATLPKGRARSESPDDIKCSNLSISQSQAADLLNVSRSQVQSAKRLIASEDHSAIAAVESGDMTLHAALTPEQHALCDGLGKIMALGEAFHASKPRRQRERAIADAEIVEETRADPILVALRQLAEWCGQDSGRRIMVEIDDAGTMRRLTITSAGIEEQP